MKIYLVYFSRSDGLLVFVQASIAIGKTCFSQENLYFHYESIKKAGLPLELLKTSCWTAVSNNFCGGEKSWIMNSMRYQTIVIILSNFTVQNKKYLHLKKKNHPK